MGSSGLHPPLVLVDLVEQQLREQILAIFGHLPQALDGMF
jgi:hypothetical protein